MRNRLATLAAAALLSAGVTLPANHAAAMPVADGAAVKSAATSHVDQVRWRRGWGIGAGILGGAIIGGAIANSYGYGPGYYYGPGPYYYGPPAPAYYGPPPGDAIGYCMSRFKSYDPGSGTYLGYDGYRHPCP